MPRRVCITGERRDRRHIVFIDEAPVALSGALFQCLCSLAERRLATTTGYAPCDDTVHPLSVHRLRRLLGPDCIQNGAFREYRLAEPPQIDPSFRELPSAVLPQSLFEKLSKFAGIELKSARNRP